jgi:hypothetical protein
MMRIKPSKNRILFERLLKKIGYRDRDPILKHLEQIEKSIENNQYHDIADINGFFILFHNKKSFLYDEFVKHFNGSNKKEIKSRINKLANRIKFKEKNPICEVGWAVKYKVDPRSLTLEINRSILFAGIKGFPKLLKNGMENISPRPNVILIGKTTSQNSIVMGLDSFDLVTKRASLAKKFGFGKLDEFNYVYGIYDENLNLNPI